MVKRLIEQPSKGKLAPTMEEEEVGMRLHKRFSDRDEEVDYKTTSGTACSQLLQLSTSAASGSLSSNTLSTSAANNSMLRSQEQKFFRQAALVSQNEKEQVIMQKVLKQ